MMSLFERPAYNKQKVSAASSALALVHVCGGIVVPVRLIKRPRGPRGIPRQWVYEFRMVWQGVAKSVHAVS